MPTKKPKPSPNIVSVTLGSYGIEVRWEDGFKASFGKDFLRMHKGKRCEEMTATSQKEPVKGRFIRHLKPQL
jgi:hypothetical protein